MMRNLMIFAAAWMLLAAGTVAQELPPIKPIPRLLPPQGVKIDQAERDKLEARLKSFVIKPEAKSGPHADLIPDVEVYLKAVRWALDFDEFYDAKKDIAKAHAALDTAEDRLHFLRIEKPAWTTQRGLVVRGYRSDIDDSVQPYGLHIPEKLDLTKPVPLLVWLHGRGDKETDLHFIATRQMNKGEFAPDWCITLHPFGRGTIGFKFAGEIDVLDAIESVKKRYKIDEDRIALAGFSMGGAGAWHIGAHYADRFCVVHAGAGFVETARYNKLTPDKYPAWYEQKLWGWYDVPCYTRNLFNVPVIAYSGELDKQKQAADLMAEAFKAEGRELRHIIGPGVEHKYEAKAKEQVLAEIKKAVEKGREKHPKLVNLQTRSAPYSAMYWVEVIAQLRQWEDTRIDAGTEDERIVIQTKNVSVFRLDLKHLLPRLPTAVVVDGQLLHLTNLPPGVNLKNLALLVLEKENDKWRFFDAKERSTALWARKNVLFSTPIDGLLMRRFIVVTPSRESASPLVNRWIDFEVQHLKRRWRELFRGDLRVKMDSDVTASEANSARMILWGTPETNLFIRHAMLEADLSWTGANITVGSQTWSAANHIPVLVHRERFVINSGPTFREGHDRTNSQQTPKLPDWAIIGLDKDPDAFAPGEIKAAGFFDENWKVKAKE